jgi:SAM-dependent methyltransferase
MNANIEETYHIDEYYRSKKAYKLFLSSLEAVFNFSIVDSFLDLGCINGSLIAEIKKSYSHVNVVGVDYFAWAKEAAAESVRDKIVLADLSQDFDLHQKYDIVNCTELGEHIEKDREAVFLANVVKHVNDILILSWSNQPAEQHLNPRPKDYIIKCVERLGLSYWPSASRNLAVSLKDNLEIFETYYWWSDNILVFKRQTFAKLNCDYFIRH